MLVQPAPCEQGPGVIFSPLKKKIRSFVFLEDTNPAFKLPNEINCIIC